jgi:hypothetical protein
MPTRAPRKNPNQLKTQDESRKQRNRALKAQKGTRHEQGRSIQAQLKALGIILPGDQIETVA